MPATTFTWFPNFGSQHSVVPKVQVTKFGEYEARVPVGINNQAQKWSVKFDVERSVGIAILAFLKARGASQAFNWTNPYEEAGVYVCRQWDSVSTNGFLAISCSFEQVFEF